jgi:competence ComEA-like helix-hairpin-helix protein
MNADARRLKRTYLSALICVYLRPNAIFSLALCILPAVYGQTELPDGPGKRQAQKICGNCHEIETVVSSRRTKIGWQQITDDMISRGAEGTDEEMAAVVAYLTEWFGKINVNTASATELEKTLGFSEKEARALLTYREQNGKIASFEELEKVPGLQPEKLRQKRNRIALSQ